MSLSHLKTSTNEQITAIINIQFQLSISTAQHCAMRNQLASKDEQLLKLISLLDRILERHLCL